MIRFTCDNGNTYELEADWNRLIPNLQTRGIRVFRPKAGVLIPIDKIVLIEDLDQLAAEELEEVKEVEIVEEEAEEAKSSDEVVEDSDEEEEEQLDIEQRKEKILKEMAEKSSCEHENRSIYYQEIMGGPRGNRTAQKRYFPVCDFCGVRERYIKADSLTDEEKANAKLWDK
jgi:hypothetical protein